MDAKIIFSILIVTTLLAGCVCAADNMANFKVDQTFNLNEGPNYALFLNEKQDSGITIYKNADDDAFGDDNDAFDNLIHDDGREYIIGDDDFKLDKNADNTGNFTDYDHAEHGVVELIKKDGQEYIAVFWAKDTSDIDTAKLTAELTQFNKDNNVEAIAF